MCVCYFFFFKQKTAYEMRISDWTSDVCSSVLTFFETYDLLVCPTSVAPAFDVNLRHRIAIDGVKLENYIAGSVITSGISMTACPAISIPCGFDRFGRPVGLQIVGPPQAEAAVLRAAALFERQAGLDRHLPVDPRAGTVAGD